MLIVFGWQNIEFCFRVHIYSNEIYFLLTTDTDHVSVASEAKTSRTTQEQKGTV